jgi:hypothetical protein
MPKNEASGYNPIFRYGKRDSSTSGTAPPQERDLTG